MFCGPSILYLGFSLIQILIDLYKGLYNTTFIKFIIMIVFTVFLNILCQSGLTVISWFIVFIPFISMTLITSLLLMVFGLNPSLGNVKQISENQAAFTYNNTGLWKMVFADGSSEIINVVDGSFMFNGLMHTLLDTQPISFNWYNGVLQKLDYVDNNGIVHWTTTSTDPKFAYVLWIPSTMDAALSSESTPEFTSTSSGQYKVIYENGKFDIIDLVDGSFRLNGDIHTLNNTVPITIDWNNGTVQTFRSIDAGGVIRWTTNSSDSNYKNIIWYPITITVTTTTDADTTDADTTDADTTDVSATDTSTDTTDTSANTTEYKIVYENGDSDRIKLSNRTFKLNNITYKLNDTIPVTISWRDGSTKTFTSVDENGVIKWTVDDGGSKKRIILWYPKISNQTDTDAGGLSPSAAPPADAAEASPDTDVTTQKSDAATPESTTQASADTTESTTLGFQNIIPYSEFNIGISENCLKVFGI